MDSPATLVTGAGGALGRLVCHEDVPDRLGETWTTLLAMALADIRQARLRYKEREAAGP